MHQSKIISGNPGAGRYLLGAWGVGFAILLGFVSLLINFADLGYDYVYTNYLSNIAFGFCVLWGIVVFFICLFLISTKNYSFEFLSNSIIVKSYIFVRKKEYMYQDITCFFINTKHYNRSGGGNISIDIKYNLYKISTGYFFEVNNFRKSELKAFILELEKRSIPYIIN